MNEHKNEIVSTRTGCMGGSDAKMLMQIANLNEVPKSAYKRMAVCNGLIPHEQFTNRAMDYGNFIEDCVYRHLHANDERWQSNPCLVSNKYSRDNVKCIDHVDFLLQDDDKRVLTIGECKATKFTFQQTRHEYEAQLMHHYLMGMELAEQLGGYKLIVLLCHYDTSATNIEEDFVFDENKLTVKNLKFAKHFKYDLNRAMDLTSEFLKGFDTYYEGDEIESQYLPEKVKEQFNVITNVLAEIKEREEKVNEFKRKLYDFMLDKNIKGIRSEEWSITRVDASESKSFDGKKYLADLKDLHPRKAKKIEEKYTKTVARGGYVKILVRKDNNE